MGREPKNERGGVGEGNEETLATQTISYPIKMPGLVGLALCHIMALVEMHHNVN